MTGLAAAAGIALILLARELESVDGTYSQAATLAGGDRARLERPPKTAP